MECILYAETARKSRVSQSTTFLTAIRQVFVLDFIIPSEGFLRRRVVRQEHSWKAYVKVFLFLGVYVLKFLQIKILLTL